MTAADILPADHRRQTADGQRRIGEALTRGMTAPLWLVRLMESRKAEPATHWPECWREPGHHACAVAEIERLRRAVPDEVTDRVMRWRWLNEIRPNPLAEGRKDDWIIEASQNGLGTWWSRLFTRHQVAARFADGSLVGHWVAEIRFPNSEGMEPQLSPEAEK